MPERLVDYIARLTIPRPKPLEPFLPRPVGALLSAAPLLLPPATPAELEGWYFGILVTAAAPDTPFWRPPLIERGTDYSRGWFVPLQPVSILASPGDELPGYLFSYLLSSDFHIYADEAFALLARAGFLPKSCADVPPSESGIRYLGSEFEVFKVTAKLERYANPGGWVARLVHSAGKVGDVIIVWVELPESINPREIPYPHSIGEGGRTTVYLPTRWPPIELLSVEDVGVARALESPALPRSDPSAPEILEEPFASRLSKDLHDLMRRWGLTYEGG